MENAIVVLSGGQDSTTCLFKVLAENRKVHAITFDYEQRHRAEIYAAQRIAVLAAQFSDNFVSHEVISVGPILKGTSPLVSKAEKLEQYKDHHSLPGGLEKTFVPMRNQLFLTIAANRALVHRCSTIVTGVCQEDYGGYPDCRQVFIDTLEQAINFGSFVEPNIEDYIDIETPLMDLTKKETVELALATPGAYEMLAWTHTAYDGQYPPVGHDHATLLRAKGFEEAGVPDPLVLRAWHDKLMELPDTPNYAFEAIQKTNLEFSGQPVDTVRRVK